MPRIGVEFPTVAVVNYPILAVGILNFTEPTNLIMDSDPAVAPAVDPTNWSALQLTILHQQHDQENGLAWTLSRQRVIPDGRLPG
jgi:hypothetical protein